MIVYRITRTKYANDLSGEGARLNGGRWNQKLIPCVYTSESRALATLEYTVNINIDTIPRALSVVTIEIPENNIQVISLNDLPGDWYNFPTPPSAMQFGTKLLTVAKTSVIKIPSAVIHDEFNYLLNPIHSEASFFRIVSVKDFIYDVRIKLT